MSEAELTQQELEQLAARGIPEEEARRQLALLRDPPPPAHLLRPARVGDGIVRVDEAKADALIARHDEGAAAARLSRFIPASGAASRMFKTLTQQLEGRPAGSREELARRAREGERPAADTLTLMEQIERFAFSDERARELAAREDDHGLLSYLLTDEGLALADKAKGLIPFHREGPIVRTPFEEHLAESAALVRDAEGHARNHFTVPPEQQAAFEDLLDLARGGLEARHGARFLTEFSVQDPATDTLAIEPGGAPFRTSEGELLLRPGGHGALIRNLDRLAADIVLIKNIDNVVPEARRGPTIRHKKILVGAYLELEEAIRGHLAALVDESPSREALEAAAAFVRKTLDLDLGHLLERDPSEAASRLVEALDRPIRVVGVVPNQGEPGGGPFWVRDSEGRASLQIVEGAQVDKEDPEQAEILSRATHFNPVDLVCGLRDRRGEPWELERFVDPQTAFVAKKSNEGRDLLALERPGLWNGAMAFWITRFVEVPVETFAPVKTVLDLLRPEHQG